MADQRAGLNLFALKDHNTALVLSALRAAGDDGTSQSSLALASRLSPQAISKIVARLGASGLIASAGRAPSTGGKPATLLRLQSTARTAIGVHLDVHRTTIVLQDLAGAELTRRSIPIGMIDPVDDVLHEIDAQLQGPDAGPGGSELLGIGVACPGPLDEETGVLLDANHPRHWWSYPMREEFQRRYGTDVVVVKDSTAATRAVLDLNAFGQNHLYVRFGEGRLGAGLILNGAVHRGERNYTSEFGHQVVEVDGPVCTCGRHGCLEILSLRAVAEGDLDEAARLIAVAVENLDLLVGLDRVLIGGTTVETEPALFRDRVRSALANHSPVPEGRVVTIGEDDGLVARGAADHVLDKIFT